MFGTDLRDREAVDSYPYTSLVVWHLFLCEDWQSLPSTRRGRPYSLSHCPSPPPVPDLHLEAVELEPGLDNCHCDL